MLGLARAGLLWFVLEVVLVCRSSCGMWLTFPILVRSGMRVSVEGTGTPTSSHPNWRTGREESMLVSKARIL